MVLLKVVASAPGKIILSGEHAVVYGTEAIACAIDVRTTCTGMVSPSSREFRLSFGEMTIDRVWDMAEVLGALEEDGESICLERMVSLAAQSERLQTTGVQVILSLFLLIAGKHFKNTGGLTIMLTTDLPVGGGLGSSASLCVAIATCLLVMCEEVPKDEMKWSDVDIETVNRFAFKGEKVVHGAPSGIDNMTITSGHFLSFKGGHISYLHDLKGAKLNGLVVNTRQPRSTKQLVQKVKEQEKKFPELYSSIFRSIGLLTESLKEALLKTTTTTTSTSITDSPTTTTTTTTRITTTCDTDVIGDIERLVDMNQSLLECIGVGHPDITRILNVCSEHNLHGKLTGAGGGGCVFVVLPQRLQENEIQAVVEQLTGFGYQCFRTLLGGPGAHVIEASPASPS